MPEVSRRIYRTSVEHFCLPGISALHIRPLGPRLLPFYKYLRSVTIHHMRTRMSFVVVTLILLTCLVCPVMQMFDRWDHELETGQDTESALVVVALCLGVTFSIVRAIVTSRQAAPSGRISTACRPLSSSLQILIGAAATVLTSASPPPITLRI